MAVLASHDFGPHWNLSFAGYLPSDRGCFAKFTLTGAGLSSGSQFRRTPPSITAVQDLLILSAVTLGVRTVVGARSSLLGGAAGGRGLSAWRIGGGGGAGRGAGAGVGLTGCRVGGGMTLAIADGGAEGAAAGGFEGRAGGGAGSGLDSDAFCATVGGGAAVTGSGAGVGFGCGAAATGGREAPLPVST